MPVGLQLFGGAHCSGHLRFSRGLVRGEHQGGRERLGPAERAGHLRFSGAVVRWVLTPRTPVVSAVCAGNQSGDSLEDNRSGVAFYPFFDDMEEYHRVPLQ